jgi:CubicO group peptidase (beta-lactamase class C family)
MYGHSASGFRRSKKVPAAVLALTVLLLLSYTAADACLALQIPDSVIANVRARVDEGWMPGMIIAVVDSSATRFFSYGVTARDGAPVNEHTIFEIGSVTKVFTSLALAEMAMRGAVRLDDPVESLLPNGVRMPRFGAHQVTLQHLALHLSAIPDQPTNLGNSDADNPWAAYDSTALFEFLNGFALPHAPGERFRYSNLGSGLLGYVLARRERTDYENLIQRRVTAPLGLADTRIELSPAQQQRVAQGHAEDGSVAAAWTFDALAGAGGLRSTGVDLARLLQAALGHIDSPLDTALQLMLGWNERRLGDRRILYHGGRTGGFRAFVGLDFERRRGVVVLANSSEGVDDIGFHLLDPQQPLNPVHRVLSMSPEMLDSYVGEYELKSGAQLRVGREHRQLIAHIVGLGSGRIYPSAPDQFFARASNAQFSFARDASGRAATVAVILHGQLITGRRIH